MKKITGFVSKLFISGILLFYLFYLSDLVNVRDVMNTMKGVRLSIFFAVFLIFLLNIFITTKRWSLFLPKKTEYKRLLSLSLIGYFFNTFLPGRIGGDIVKTFYIYRDTGEGVTSIVSVFLDRYMGIFAIIVISVLAFIGGYSSFHGTKIESFIPAIFGLFLIGNVILWKVNWGKMKSMSSFYASLMEFKTRKRILLKGLLLSLAIQAFCILGVYLLSIAIGLTVPIIYFFIFVPIINAFSAIPISIAGLGVREVGFAALFGMFFSELGVTTDQAVSISILAFAAMVLVNVIGGIEYVRIRKLSEE